MVCGGSMGANSVRRGGRLLGERLAVLLFPCDAGDWGSLVQS